MQMLNKINRVQSWILVSSMALSASAYAATTAATPAAPAPVAAAAGADSTITSMIQGRSAWEILKEKGFFRFDTTFYGPTLGNPLSPMTQSDGGEPMHIDSTINVGYKVLPNLTVGVGVPFDWRLTTGQQVVLGDVYARAN
jgi:hypothetical protein